MISFELEDVPVNVTAHIKKFREFLIQAWPHLNDMMEYHDWDEDVGFMGDWVVVNWQILVERELLQDKGRLATFGSSQFDRRVILPDAKSNYAIYAKGEGDLVDVFTKKKIDESYLRLYNFLTFTPEKIRWIRPPFDLACLIGANLKNPFTLPFDDLEFYLDKYEAPPEG